MRFIAHSRVFQIQCIEQRERPGPFGPEVIRPGYTAEFRYADVTTEDVAFAEQAFQGELNGRTYELDEVTPTTILNRLSTFDTEAPENVKRFLEIDQNTWNPATKEYGMPEGTTKHLVEQKLLERQSAGNQFALVQEPTLAPPWPSYNDFVGSVDDLAMKVLDDGYNVSSVIAFEKSRDGLKRVDVIEALTAAEQMWRESRGEVVSA